MIVATEEMHKYFQSMESELKVCHQLAAKARSLNFDPEPIVSIKLAKNMAERVEALISIVAPQMIGSGVTKRIIELEKKYGNLDWRVALCIAHEVALQKFCKFSTKKEALEIGIRTGFAYQTGGIVAAPLEGFIELKIKKTNNGEEYLAPCYAGPIRGAGGTAAAFSLMIVDYIRFKMGYAKYDPSDAEINRFKTEIFDYNDRVTNLQYLPSPEEVGFLMKRLPIEIEGDPTEKIEVSNYKDLPRVETNRIRGGVCLVLAEGLSQKAPKLWKRLDKWGVEFGFEWEFLGEFLKIQKEIKAKRKSGTKATGRISPNYTFIADLVAGRPVITHPMTKGGLRLRYGRSRVSGFSAACIHPASTYMLKKYIAVGTQLKIERPGKAAAVTPCDSISGPIVKLDDGSVVYVETLDEAKKYLSNVKEILFLGDILINYGDFSENGHILVPCGYNEEWWLRDIEKRSVDLFGTIDFDKIASLIGLDVDKIELIFKDPIKNKISVNDALILSHKLNVPLHPFYTFHWNHITFDKLNYLSISWKNVKKVEEDGVEFIRAVLKNNDELKRIFEDIGCPHQLVNHEFIVFNRHITAVLDFILGKYDHNLINEEKTIVENISILSGIRIKDKSGTFIGARMGRPEKAKMRKMTGSPQVLFPVGDEGGRTRSFQAALDEGKVTGDFVLQYCADCKKETIYKSCEDCGKETRQLYYCRRCGVSERDKCQKCNGVNLNAYMRKEIDIKHFFKKAVELFNERMYPDLIKGVRGTSNKDHIPEHLVKGIIRAKHDIYVNKDGTIRFDMSELPITHFKPNEIGTSIEKLNELGYNKDIYGKNLICTDQIVELKPQDLILPGATDGMEEPASSILFRVANFIDELLMKLYKMEPYYKLNHIKDLVGHLVIGLAPHISAGMVGRIVGFSKTQGMFAHPMYHAALRRDCFGSDTFIPLYYGGSWHIKQIGEFVDCLCPMDVVDDYGTKEIKTNDIETYGEFGIVKVNNFTKHTPQDFIKIKTKLGRTLKLTKNHKQIIFKRDKQLIKQAKDLCIGDIIGIPYSIQIPKRSIKKLDLLHYLHNEDWVMVRNVNSTFSDVKKYALSYFSKKNYDNYVRRDSYPIKFIYSLYSKGLIKDISSFNLAGKRDNVVIPIYIPITKEFLQIIGLYIAEGYSRKVSGRLYQVYIAAENNDVRYFIKKAMSDLFGLSVTEKKKDRLTYSSRILYHLFTSILNCGSSAYEKRIPSLFLNLSNEQMGHMLSGYFEGDGSVSSTDLRITFDTVSKGLLRDMDFVFGQMGIFVKNYTYTSIPSKKLCEFYKRKGREIPKFTITKGIIQSVFVDKFSKYIYFISTRKKDILDNLLKSRKAVKIHQDYTETMMFDMIVGIEEASAEINYCLNAEGNKIIANSILTKQCDGDEASVSLLMDGFLNFSSQYLPDTRGAKTMDAPLVLTSIINPAEVDDQVHGIDIVWQYPLELYEAAEQFKNPWEVKIEQVKDRLGSEYQYEKFGFTHNTSDINSGVLVSAYKALPSMAEKLSGQMEIAKMIRAVDEDNVADMVITKHFLKDLKGNLRKFSQQQFRCVKCNEKFRRPPLKGYCVKCSGKIIFTISEGSVIKYLESSLNLARDFKVPLHTKQTLDLLKDRIDSVFGKEKEKQEGLGKWF
ncbi:MAG: DNA polymerase II large subunit [Candidatus Woesearchaeota archaeon]